MEGQKNSCQSAPYYLTLVFVGFLLFSCKPDSENVNQPVESTVDTLVTLDSTLPVQLDTFPIDSAFLKKVRFAYEHKIPLTDYRDSANADENHSEYYSVVPTKLNFNGDAKDDYVVLYVNFHHVQGFIIDGKNGRRIPTIGTNWNENGLFFNRPYPNEDVSGLELQVVNVDCSDNQDELMILSGVGCPPGSECSPITELLLYRFDPDSLKVKMIFKELVMELYDDIQEDTSTLGNRNANYIDILYSDESCIEAVKVRKGKHQVSSVDWREAKIQPIPSSKITTYKFSIEAHKFEVR